MNLLLAFVLDMILGDSHRLPHPVRTMGRAIEAYQPLFRNLPFHLTLNGLFFAVALISLTWTITWTVITIARMFHPVLGIAGQILLIYYCLSVRSLELAAKRVYQSLKQHDLLSARFRLSMIVGRDTQNLDQAGVSRAAVETVAENFVDGIVSPLLYAAICGAPAAMAFKMASTLDSMIGYRCEQYQYFGKAAARIDDILNYIPARVSIPIIALASQILNNNGKHSFVTAILHGNRHLSPNSGRPEAAFAGALRIQLGGSNIYQGQLVEKPFIGNDNSAIGPRHIKQACDLMLLSSIICVCLTMLISYVI